MDSTVSAFTILTDHYFFLPKQDFSKENLVSQKTLPMCHSPIKVPRDKRKSKKSLVS